MARANRRLCICLLNVSEARRSVVENIANSALAVNSTSLKGSSEFPLGASVLNIFRDMTYNRSVITIAAETHLIGDSVHDACCAAFQGIDLRTHSGGHPRLGAVDLVPFHPVSEAVTLEECGTIARGVAERLSATVPTMSAFLFGTADLPCRRGLVERRKEVSWYRGKHGRRCDAPHDIGTKPNVLHGLTGIGAIPYVMNCNVTINTTDVGFGRKIASMIRATTPGGLPGVQSMAFPHEGKVEIACNVEGLYLDPNDTLLEDEHLSCSFGDCYHVLPPVIENRIATIAGEKGVSTVGTAIVGFTPQEAERTAVLALSTGQAQFWKTREDARMM